MADRQLDAFILFHEPEEAVAPIVEALEGRGVSTHFFRRDIYAGERFKDIEAKRLEEARTIVVFLGDRGWGPTHLELANRALELKKQLIPVLVGNPPEDAFEKVGSLFRDRLYVDLRKGDETGIEQLVRSIQRGETTTHKPTFETQLDAIIAAIRDGDESRRAGVLEQIRLRKDLDRIALSARLRTEIQKHGPGAEVDFASAIRDPKKMSAIRSWLLSCLIWTDPEEAENSKTINEHISESEEPDRNVRFWSLAQLFVCGASYTMRAASRMRDDTAPEIKALCKAITADTSVIADFSAGLASDRFETVWPFLRALRIVPIPELAGTVCAQLGRSLNGTPLAYDALYALSNPAMASAAAPILAEKPGVAATVERVLREGNVSDPNATQNFAALLAALPAGEVDRTLEAAIADPFAPRRIAREMRGYLADRRRASAGAEVLIAGYASDTIDDTSDRLDIREDVHTLAAVILATDVKPPLAIGLFGDWGSGKSYFMRAMRQATNELAASGKRGFCSNIVSIEFNAWHYADTNLWASLVSYILEQLAAYVNPQPTPEQQQEALVAQLGSAKAMVQEAEGEKRRTQEVIKNRADELQKAKVEREQKEVKLRDLRASDFRSMVESDAELKKQLQGALDAMGLPAVLGSMSDLVQVVSEAGTARGRIAALITSVMRGKDRRVTIILLGFVMLVIPGMAWLLNHLGASGFFVGIGAVAAQVTAFAMGAKKVLSRALEQVKTNLGNVEAAKRKIDKLLEDRRHELSDEEKKLQKDIVELKAKEQESEARLAAAAARVVELEERISSLNQGRSLVQFLSERTRSDDYRKHLGLISTIRQDFEKLGQQLSQASIGGQFKRVDRIILYIDDLDRCHEAKVMEVLQAVHLLLAYPLFVVVVGVDPRWLLHSLKGAHRAFRGSEQREGVDGEMWRTTPQNYLEKIFQIPFNLRSMTSEGYTRLVKSLLLPEKDDGWTEQKVYVERINDTERGIAGLTPRPEAPPESSSKPGGDAKAAELMQGDPVVETAKPVPDKKKEGERLQFVIYEESLAIKSWEAAFAARLFALIPTPRGVKRFTNVYRILKAPVSRVRLRTFEGTTEWLGEFQLPMLLLAMLIGSPSESVKVFPHLWIEASSGRSATEVLRNLAGLLGKSTKELGVLQEKIRPIVGDAAFPTSADLIREWLPRVSRFSFDVGRAVEAARYLTTQKATGTTT